MDICLAISDEEISACFPVLRELRPYLEQDQFLTRVHSLQATGYQLVQVIDTAGVIAVAGFRILESFAWGRFLYIDDLVTQPQYRSQGVGTKLLYWLIDHASQLGCQELHLDSGLQRLDAHRFYQREGVQITGYHFAAKISS
jgi:GNAT superfamily N-acetyltransferase